MENITGGLGDKMEDWVEKQHQMGKQERARFRIMKNLQHCSDARARVVHRNFDPVVIARTLRVDGAMVRRSLNLKARRDTKRGSSRCVKGSVIRRGLRHSTIAISSNNKMNTHLP